MSKLLDEETVIDNITNKCKKSYFSGRLYSARAKENRKKRKQEI